MTKKIEISYKTIVFTVLLLLGLAFIYYIQDIIFQIFVSLLIMIILNPTVTKLQKRRIPRAVSVLVVYLLIFSFIIFSIATLIPGLVEQTTNFANAIPRLMSELNIPVFVIEETTKEITSEISSLPSQVLRISLSLFSNVLSFLTVFFFALYFLLARDRLGEQLKGVLPQRYIDLVDRVLLNLEKELGGWARGQLILMFMVGLSTYIGLLILGIPYALPLALLAGILEMIPNIGPILSAIPAVLVGLGLSPLTGLAVAALGFLIQQIENYIFVPKVMERSAGVSPVITLLSLVIGFKVAGILGAVLSVPIFITARVIASEYLTKKEWTS